MFNIKSDFPIYKLNNNIFQLGEITCDNKILSNLINTLSLGDKFVPNFFLNKRSFLFYLLKYLDINILKFDNFLNICKSVFFKSKLDNLTENFIEEDLIESNVSYNLILSDLKLIEILNKVKKKNQKK